jgi:hypothetical protein
MRLISPLNSFNGVAAGQTATLKIAGQRRIHGLFLQTNATDATQLDRFVKEIRLKIGARTLYQLTVPQMLALFAYYGLPVTAGALEMHFSRAQARIPTGEEFTAFNTFGLEDITLEVEFRTNAEFNALAGVATGFAPTLTGFVEYDYFNDGNRAFIEVLPRSIANSGAGEIDFDTLEREGAYKAIHVFSNLVTRVRVYRDNVEMRDTTLAQVNQINRRYGNTAQTNHFPVDFGYTDQAQDILEMTRDTPGGAPVKVNTFNLKLTTTAAGTLPAVIERVVRI